MVRDASLRDAPHREARGSRGHKFRPHPEEALRAVSKDGRMKIAGPFLLTRTLDRGATVFLAVLAAIAIIVPVLHLAVPANSLFYVPTYFVALFGKYICYALLA